MSKGGNFERQVCKELSLWWSGGERDDMFWRTSGSGARSTVRSRKGISTFGQCGDVAATDPDAVPFVEAFAVEIKRGYPRATPIDLLDHGKGVQPQVYDIWLWKVIKEAEENGRPGWMIIHRRDAKESMAWMQMNAFRELLTYFSDACKLITTIQEPVEMKKKGKTVWRIGPGRRIVSMVGIRLEDFLYEVNPRSVRNMIGAK